MLTLYVIDAVNYLFRSYYAIGPMTNGKGESTSALYGFIRSLQKLRERFEPTHLVCVFDGPDNKRSRQALYAEYKGHRKGAPEDLLPQFAWAEEYCRLAGIPTLCVEGVEADDTMASVAVWAEDAVCYLCTSDKDLMQLIDERIFVLHPGKDYLQIDAAKVEELFGVRPDQMRDLLAIMGDTSDNIPGLPGFGPKTAAALLSEFGTLDAILEHPEKVKGAKKQEALRTQRAQALLSRELATLDTHVPIPTTSDAYRLQAPQDLEPFFRAMQFRSLLRPQEALPVTRITSREELEQLFARLPQEVTIAIDAEGVRLEDALVPWSYKAELQRFCASVSLIGHDLKRVLRALEITTCRIAFDTLVAAYLLGHKDDRQDNLLRAELEEADLTRLFYDVELPLIPILARMELHGIFLDADALRQQGEHIAHRLHALQQEIFALVGAEFNLNSPKQLSALLFDTLGLKRPSHAKSAYATGADVLEELSDAHPAIRLILTHRTLEKLRTTYIEALPACINAETGRIHCTFNQTVTATGRLSCQDPNLQNIPVRSEEGMAIRSCFKPQPGWSFLGADYSQIELRLLAHCSSDPNLLRAFAEGQDVHAHTSIILFGTDAMRAQAKTVNFGILYGQGPFSLARQLHISYQEAADFIRLYFERYPRVREFLEACKEEVRQHGFSKTLFGRRRAIPEIHNPNPSIRSAAERLAINTPLQGTAADLIKMAMIGVDRALQGMQARLLLQIHDELIFEAPDAELPALQVAVRRSMTEVHPLRVPLEVQIAVGKNWAEC